MSGKYFYLDSRKNQSLNLSFKTIKKSAIAYRGLTRKDIRKKLKTKLENGCKEYQCCLPKITIDNKIESVNENCHCYKDFVECGDNCFCSKFKQHCTNRPLQQKKQYGKLEKLIPCSLRGIDPFTRRRIYKLMRNDIEKSDKNLFINKVIIKFLQKQCLENKNTNFINCLKIVAKNFKTFVKNAKILQNKNLSPFSESLDIILNEALKNPEHFQSHSKGTCVVVKENCDFSKNELIGEYIGEIYTSWRWFEQEQNLKRVRNRVLKDKVILPEFYNMMLERHEKDKNGYALVVVDAKYKGNLISRVSHSCSPNAKVVVVASDGVYKIGLYALRDINGGEEITFDYFCRTDNKNEMEEAVCLCGTENCRGSFLIFSEDFSDLILKKKHNLYDRIIILLKCSLVKKISQNDLQKLKMGSCALADLPKWSIKFASLIFEYIEEEQKYLPKAIFNQLVKNLDKEVLDKKLKKINSLAYDESSFIKNKRIQSLFVTFDKLKYFLKHKNQSRKPPLTFSSPSKIIRRLWSDGDSLVNTILSITSQYLTKAKIYRLHEIKKSVDFVDGTLKCLDTVRAKLLQISEILKNVKDEKNICNSACSDLIIMYARTKYYFHSNDYIPFKSAFAEIGLTINKESKCAVGQTCYSSDYPLSLLLSWFKDAVDANFSSLLLKGVIYLPDVKSCYLEEGEKISPVYRKERLLANFEENFDLAKFSSFLSKESHFTFFNHFGLMGSPFFDSYLENGSLDSLYNELKN